VSKSYWIDILNEFGEIMALYDEVIWFLYDRHENEIIRIQEKSIKLQM